MIKYAVISDIHGNLPAFQAVLNDAVKEQVDYYIFVGDYYMCLQYPNEVVDIIKNLKNAFIIKGNNEPFLEELSRQNKETWTDGQYEALYWYYESITPENYEFLKNLPKEIKVHGQESSYINIVHSSREIFTTSLFEDLSSSIFFSCNKKSQINKRKYIQKQITDIQNDDNALEFVNNLPKGVYIFGHTHFQWHYNFDGRLLLNPGACGLPLDLDNRASYSILEYNSDGFNVKERRVIYNIEKLIKDIKISSLYKNAEVWSKLTITALMTGIEQHTFFLKFVEKYANDIGDNERPFSKQTWNDAYLLWCSNNEAGDHLRLSLRSNS